MMGRDTKPILVMDNSNPCSHECCKVPLGLHFSPPVNPPLKSFLVGATFYTIFTSLPRGEHTVEVFQEMSGPETLALTLALPW